MKDSYHFVGAGGAGMSVIAELLHQQGHTVTGSDRLESAVLERLRSRGIDVWAGHDPGRVPHEATLVVSSAIRPSNPELQVGKSRGQKVLHRSEALALAALGKRFVAVAGAHGKTTTAAMLTRGLIELGWDPSCALGGPILGPGSGAILGSGEVFVAEADESDGSFLNYRPEVALVTNIEPDHLDHFGSREAFENIFFEFASRIEPGGTLVCCADDPGAARLAARARAELDHVRVWTYGHEQMQENPDIVLTEVSLGRDSAQAEIVFRSATPEPLPVDLQVTGEHNLLNAAGALGAGVALGADPARLAAALGSFTGAGRRFETRGEAAGRRVIVDYAHHPTEIAAALRQARLAAGPGKVVAVFQPHLYTRTANFRSEFAQALAAADEIVLADIFAAREDPVPGVSSGLIAEELSQRGLDYHYEPGLSVREVAELGASLTAPGDILMLVGAGDINQGAPDAIDAWERA